MDQALLGVVILSVLGSFFLAYMSWKTWRAFQIVLVMCVLFATLAFGYLAARTLKTHAQWRSTAAAWQKKIDEVEAANQKLLEGTEEQGRLVSDGIRQLKLRLHEIAVERGTVWYGVAPQKVNGETGVCTLSVEAPEPHEIAAKTVLFAFEEQGFEEGGRYLGEFKVTKASDKTKSIEIVPNLPLTPEQAQRLKKTKGTWALYAMMPIDDATLFAELEENQRKELLPENSLKEFVGKDRTLRDYEFFFHQNAIERELLSDALVKLQADIDRVETAVQKAQSEGKYRDGEIAALQGDQQKFRYELQAIKTYAEALAQRRQTLLGQVKEIFLGNARLARQLTEQQLKAAEEIDRRTGAQASAAPAVTPTE